MSRYEFLEKWKKCLPEEKQAQFEKEFLSLLLGNQHNRQHDRKTYDKQLVPDYNDDLG